VYAASYWWGFATADDRNRLQADIRRGIRSGLCEQHHKTVQELVDEADDKLFTNIKYNKQHVNNMSCIPYFPVPLTENITLGPDRTISNSSQGTPPLLIVILLLG